MKCRSIIQIKILGVSQVARGKKTENNQSHNEDKQSNWEQPNNQQKNTQQSPPDIEEIFNNLLKKSVVNPGNVGKNGKPNSPVGLGKLLPLGVLIGAVIWGLSGFYTIKEAERGVILRFGQLHSIVQPGLNWKPTFIDSVTAVNVERVRELRTQGSMLTQDENMVKVEMTVQYRVQRSAKYLFSINESG